MKELKKSTAEELAASEAATRAAIYPSEADELKLSQCESTGLVTAALSCDDRPEMMMDVIEALKAAEAKVVRAEMCTVGERTKVVLWLKLGHQNDAGLGSLRRALKTVMDTSTLAAGSGQVLPGNKRPRYYHL